MNARADGGLGVGKWQPIESAPKDGTWVLVSGGVANHEGDNPPCVVAQYTNYLNGGTTDWHWQFAWYDGGYYGEYDDPTHWQPLPEPPES